MGQGHDQFCFVLKNARELAKNFVKIFFSWRTLEFSGKFTNFWSKDLFFSEITSALCPWPWPRKCLSSEGLSLDWNFFVSLASSLVSSTPPLPFASIDHYHTHTIFYEDLYQKYYECTGVSSLAQVCQFI